MNTSEHYRRDHLIAKVLICVLYQLVGLISIELDSPYIGLTLGTAIWLFGINTAGYLVECVAGHRHAHEWI